jgi:hypothetical protein
LFFGPSFFIPGRMSDPFSHVSVWPPPRRCKQTQDQMSRMQQIWHRYQRKGCGRSLKIKHCHWSQL